MADDQLAQYLVPTTGANTLPAVEILTGRGFITGKSGSGKSNTASVIAEELLDYNYNLLIVDPEGEYYGLKEKYEILHVGNDDLCDAQVTADHADQLAEIALERNMPIILDVSDFLDAEEASELIASTVRALFQKEKDARKPFLLMIEEMQEYLPQQGGNDELSELLERVAKRGRKRGLGMLGMSQRPSSVDKDFITQCDWMVWHRLTWQNDLDVVKKVLGSDVAAEVEDLDTGEGYLMTDWDESVDRVQFKRKETHDAGATPGLESYERPDLKSVSQDLVQQIEGGEPTLATDDEDTSELSENEKTELESAIETEQNRNGFTATSGDAETTNPASTKSESGDTTPESLHSQMNGDVDEEIESLEEAELRDRLRTLQQRNQVLQDEVSELRSILKRVDSPDSNTRASNGSHTDEQRSGTQVEEPVPAPSRPVPPDPPVRREGVAGNLVEFVAMVGYLLRAVIYRCRLWMYYISESKGGSPEPEEGLKDQ